VTAAGLADPGCGARSRTTGDAILGRELIPAPEGTGAPFPRASSVVRCAICEKPRADAPVAPDTEHSPCDRTTRRMEADLAARRSGSTTDPLTAEW
jgi:hypothetical protein